MCGDPVFIQPAVAKPGATQRLSGPPPLIRLLLVDDESCWHVLLRAILAKEPPCGVELYGADTMGQGFEIIDAVRPHVLLQDLKMTSGGMAETLAYFPEIMRRAPTMPILAFTGSKDDDTWRRSIEAGAINCLHKDVYLDPVNRSALLHSIMNAMIVYRRHPAFVNHFPPHGSQ